MNGSELGSGKQEHGPARRRFAALIVGTVAACLFTPAAAHAQLDIRLTSSGRFSMPMSTRDVSVVQFLAEGAAIHAETRTSPPVILFVARVSNGKLVSQGQTEPFLLNAEAAASAEGIVLGSVLDRRRLLALSEAVGAGKAVVTSYLAAGESTNAAELVARPSTAFSASGAGTLADQKNVLIFAVVPADAGLRLRSKAGALFAVGSPLVGD